MKTHIETNHQREWVRPAEIRQIFGFSRPMVYELINRGVIKSSSLRAPGKLRGVRLVNVESVRKFIESGAQGG